MVGGLIAASERFCPGRIGPAAKITAAPRRVGTAVVPEPPAAKLVPSGAMTSINPLVSQFIKPVCGLFLKVPDTAYQRHSPPPSRKGGSSRVFHGRRPITVASVAPQADSAVPSPALPSTSGQGR